MGKIGITVTDGAGEVHELTDTEVYELRSMVSGAVNEGLYNEQEAVLHLLRILAPPYLRQEDETEEHHEPWTVAEAKRRL